MTAFSPQTAAQEPTFPSLPSAKTLTEHLLTYDFPAGFAERLAEEESWTLAFAQGVLGEYRRFLVLAATARQRVTPSRAVDAAWHLHLTYTRDYWLRLTPLLPAALHHEPSGGQAGEAAHFARQYLATLTLYQAHFGDPNPLIWPRPGRAAPRKTGRVQRRFPSWLALLTLWALGGAALARFGIWAVAGLLVLGFVLLAEKQGQGRRHGSADGGAGGCLGLMGDSGSGQDSGCADGGGSCGSGCGGDCGS